MARADHRANAAAARAAFDEIGRQVERLERAAGGELRWLRAALADAREDVAAMIERAADEGGCLEDVA